MRLTVGLGVLAIALGLGSTASASSLTCELDGVSTGCYSQDQIFANNTVDWMAAFGEATEAPSSGPWVTSSQGIAIDLTSVGLLQRADNTVFAWYAPINGWTLPDIVAGTSVTTFAGHFGAPDSPSSTPPFGDSLIGVGGNSLRIDFSAPILSAGFQVSTRSAADFTATLQALDANNNVIGTYTITATGLGGVCAGLANPVQPQPCDDAPLIAFLGNNPQVPMIQSLVLTTNDPNGMFIDSLLLNTGPGSGVPEPSVTLMIGSGLCVVGLLRYKRKIRSR